MDVNNSELQGYNPGFVRVASCSPEVVPGNPFRNSEIIIDLMGQLEEKGVKIAVFPELCITGYTCADLFSQQQLLADSERAMRNVAEATSGRDIVVIVGVPVCDGGSLYNCAAILGRGDIIGLVPKKYIPNYSEFYERRWFRSGPEASEGLAIRYCNRDIPFGAGMLFRMGKILFGAEICEDLWVPVPPSCGMAMAGAEIIFNLSATDEVTGKHDYILELVRSQSARCRCAYVYASAGDGESSTDMAFAGNCMIAEDGRMLSQSDRFVRGGKYTVADIDVAALKHDRQVCGTFTDALPSGHRPVVENIPVVGDRKSVTDPEEILRYRRVDPTPFVDKNPEMLARRCDEISSIQAWGLSTRLKNIGGRRAVIGISGGLDSTLALLVTVKAFDMLGLDRKGIFAVTMPGFGTTSRTHTNAEKLMELLGVTAMEISIADAVIQHFKDIGQDPEKHDITYENSQARERTQILMDLANKENALVIGTGDLSELALGWCTYNGDQMSMYGVNASIPKTLVRYLVEGYATRSESKALRGVLLDIADTPISPELLPPNPDDSIEQKTEDVVGPYELHDFFLYRMLRYGDSPERILILAIKAFKGKYDISTIVRWLETFIRRFFAQQFKRSCMPDGVKVGSVCLSPRGDWRMPSDIKPEIWLDALHRAAANLKEI